MSGPFPFVPDPDHPELERIRRGLAEPPPRLHDPGELRRSAVLVPLFSLGGELQALFTLRSPQLRHHAGQISFPGGGIEPSDADALGAALREAREELGLDASSVELLGRLDDVPTRTGFHIVPWVVAIVRPFTPAPQTEEVAEVFHLPLAAFRAESAARVQRVEWKGKDYPLLAFFVGGREVWGATAWIVRALCERVWGPMPHIPPRVNP